MAKENTLSKEEKERLGELALRIVEGRTGCPEVGPDYDHGGPREGGWAHQAAGPLREELAYRDFAMWRP